MDRRKFVTATLAAGAAHGLPALAAAPDHVLDAGVSEQLARMQAGTLSAQALTQACLDRIAALDKTGPAVNAIIELNPDALAIAATLDQERKDGKLRGPLHGIPVVLKDVIATADKMCTSAGSLALDGVRARRDAHLVTRLRAAGAVILAKTNLTEWCNLRSPGAVTGWSARGGLSRNPYALDRSCGGSSSGSGAAVAAGMVPLAVGTETDGSIVCPASICGLVGIKPTVGLISRRGMIRVTRSQDTAGPMARSVADAALLLAALAGKDPQDPLARATPVSYLDALKLDGLKGMRIGVARNYFVRDADVAMQIAGQLRVLEANGAKLINVVVPNKDSYQDSDNYGLVLLTEFKHELAAWLAEYAPQAPVKNLADIIAFNKANASREMQHFKQELLQFAQTMGPIDNPRYREALAHCQRNARGDGLDMVIKENALDALVAPTSVPGWVTEFGKRGRGDPGFTTPAAIAGYPHITVPAGFVRGLPVGLSFVGPAWSEARLLGMAYAYEQATRHRRAPAFAPTLGS